MEQRDHLKRQIDQLGRVLGKILSDLLRLKNQGQFNDGIEITNQILKDELNLDIQKLMSIHSDKFVDILKTEKGFDNISLNTLADILLLIADNTQGKEKKSLYEKCLTIYEYLDKTEDIYSLDRQWKIVRIKNML